MAPQPSEWTKISAANGFSQISTTGKKVKTKDCRLNGKFPVIDQGQDLIAGYVDDPDKLINVSDSLIVFGDHTRAVKWLDFSFVPGADGTKILQPASYLFPRFAYYQLRSLEIPNKGYSRHFKFLKELEFAVPPFAEQKVIADKLDTLLAPVENTKARLERIPQILRRFRQSVLAAAVSGRLTEEWRSQNSLTPPSETWPGCEEITKCFDIPSDWAGVALGSVSERVSVGHVGKTSEFYTDEGSGIPFLRSQNVRPGRISLDGLAHITEHFHQSLRKSQLQPGDLLIVRVGANRGDACVLPSIFPQVNCANIVFARPKQGLSPYLNLYFQSPLSQELLLGTTVGGAQGVINTKSVAQTFLALPPVEEQSEIVHQVDELFACADRIEQQVNNALARVNNLTQSILAKAFRGELSERWRKDNPELISGENSAKALLERIKAERASMKPANKNRKRTPA